MSNYIVTDEDGCYALTFSDRAGMNGQEWAMDVEDAAAMWAEKVHPDFDFPDEMTAIVIDPFEKKWRCTVTVEAVPSFHAIAKEEP